MEPPGDGARRPNRGRRRLRSLTRRTRGREAGLSPQSSTFQSILTDGAQQPVPSDQRRQPAFFTDLNLDQIVQSVTASRQEYDLTPIFYDQLHDLGSITHRHEVFRDLEKSEVSRLVGDFATKMRAVREHLDQVGKLHYKLQRQSWFLDAIGIYCRAVTDLSRDLDGAELRSRGLVAVREYVSEYAKSRGFAALLGQTERLKHDLAAIRYCVNISGNRVRVTRYDSEPDYSAEVADTFEKFKQGAVKSYLVKFYDYVDMNHVDANVLELVAQLHPDSFSALEDYCERYRESLDPTIVRFDREVQFYASYLEYMEIFRRAGLKFCYPSVSRDSKEVRDDDAFDLALADKLVARQSPVICNDFYLQDPERVFVISGPNQGGKTTFARTFGQLHYLAGLGLPVPGEGARLFLPDRLFTHFEREEDLTDLNGKLQDDLVRIHDVLDRATGDSIVILNEIFTSTTLTDAVSLGTKVLQRVIQRGLLCVCVTFVDELASLSEVTVSMVSTVVPDDPAVRTYKVIRRPADGLSYATAIAEKYQLTYQRLKERIAS